MRTAIVTASYSGDFERCRLLCDSIDRNVSGYTRHFILVEEKDMALFARLAGPRREIVGERELLPFWLRPFPDPASLGRRRIWLSPFGPPLRGWHVQQLRRIALGARMDEEVLVSCDSDVVFVKPFDAGTFTQGRAVRFHRVPASEHRIADAFAEDHRQWSRRAGELLGIRAPRETAEGYIATAIAWRTDTVRAMVERIESVTGRSWVAAVAASRAISECTIYGRFVDEVENRLERHEPTTDAICRIYWAGAALGASALRAFVDTLKPQEVAIGLQSFTGTDPTLIRRVAGLD